MCGAGSLCNGRVSVRLSVCPPLCPIDRQQQQQRAAGLLLIALRAEISIDSCRRAAGTCRASPTGAGAQQQTRLESRWQPMDDTQHRLVVVRRAWVQIAVATLSGNSLRQTVHSRHASVHQAAKLVAAVLRFARVTAGLAESNGSLPPGL